MAMFEAQTVRESNYKVPINAEDGYGGAMIRFDRMTGAAVYMLYAKPGIYLNDHNSVVPEEFAARAGFDVERFGKMRRKQEAIQAATAQIEAQFKFDSGPKVIAELGEYRLVDVGHDMFSVQFEDGTPLGKAAPRQIAMDTFKMLSGYVEPVAEEPAKRTLQEVVDKPE